MHREEKMQMDECKVKQKAIDRDGSDGNVRTIWREMERQ